MVKWLRYIKNLFRVKISISLIYSVPSSVYIHALRTRVFLKDLIKVFKFVNDFMVDSE